jgi:hypothetical protein
MAKKALHPEWYTKSVRWKTNNGSRDKKNEAAHENAQQRHRQSLS